jgi:hypothetical protein
MLDEDKGHAITCGQRADKLFASIEAARGRTYCDDDWDIFSRVARRSGQQLWASP